MALVGNWVDLGRLRQWSLDRNTWFGATNNTTFLDNGYVRFGNTGALDVHDGKVIMGWNFAGAWEGPPPLPLRPYLYALRGNVYPEDEPRAPNPWDAGNPNLGWSMFREPAPADLRPIGLVTAGMFGGIQTSAPLRFNNDQRVAPTIQRNLVLVADKPLIAVKDMPSSVDVGDRRSFTINVKHANGLAIPGVRIDAYSRNSRTGVGLVDAPTPMLKNLFSATLYTDTEGNARFAVVGVRGGSDDLVLSVERGELYRPELPDSYPITVNGDDTPPEPGTCIVYPAIPGRATQLPTTRTEVDTGWTAGANSVTELVGDVLLEFTQPVCKGVVLGLTGTRDNPQDYSRVTHGYIFGSSAAGEPTYQVIESGRVIGPVTRYAPASTIFRIRRSNSAVTYAVFDGFAEDVVYTSGKTSDGLVMAGCSLYSSGDSVESEETP